MASLSLAAGCLLFRFADGFARNALLANQILLFQLLAGLGSNGAQRCAKYLSSACSLAPLLLGGLREAFGFSLMAMALAGGLLQGLCTLAVALAALEPQRHLGVCLLASYAMAYGAVVSSMPLLTRSAAPSSFRSGLMQAFVALLSAGGLLGIAAAALARSYRADHWALSCAVLVLLLGLGCLAGGVPLRCARRLVACALRLEPEHLESWEEPEAEPLAGATPAVEAKKSLHELRPLLWPLFLLLPFYGAAVQWTTSWYVQAMYLDRRVLGFQVPACLLQAFERTTNLLVMTGLRGTELLSTSRRLALGSLLAACAMFTSGLVEHWRRDGPRLEGEISALNITWLLPQFALIAAAEAFIYPASTELLSGSSVAYGLGCAVQAAAVALLGLLLNHLKGWIPEASPNEGHYDWFFDCLGLACLLSALLFGRS